MRSLVAAVLLGLGAMTVMAATPQHAEAAWWDRRGGYYAGYYAPAYYGASVAYVNPYAVSAYVEPAYVAPAYVAPAYYSTYYTPAYVAPYTSFSIGTYGWGRPAYYGGYRGGYYRRW